MKKNAKKKWEKPRIEEIKIKHQMMLSDCEKASMSQRCRGINFIPPSQGGVCAQLQT